MQVDLTLSDSDDDNVPLGRRNTRGSAKSAVSSIKTQPKTNGTLDNFLLLD